MDVLSDMLAAMRLSGGVIVDTRFRAPWSVINAFGPEDCAPFFPMPKHVIAYHYVRSGRLWARIGDEPPVEVRSGEIILFPRNHPHSLFSDEDIEPVASRSLMRPGENGGLTRIDWGGPGEESLLFCGFLGSMTPNEALLQSLPPMLKIAADAGPRGEWTASSLRFAADELRADSQLLGRIAELLFAEAVRRHVQSLPPGEGGWLAGLGDAAVGRALAYIHARSTKRIDVTALARHVGLSRSALGERFTALLGEPPVRYWTRWRLRAAANRLQDGRLPAARVAYDSGFNSEAAFSRAFKREYGLPPAAWARRQRKAGATVAG